MDLKFFGGTTNFEMSKSKSPSQYCKDLPVHWPISPGQVVSLSLSAGPWDLSDTLSSSPWMHPAVHLGQAQECSSAAGVGWAGLANSSCSKETVALGVTVGNKVQRDARIH